MQIVKVLCRKGNRLICGGRLRSDTHLWGEKDPIPKDPDGNVSACAKARVN